VRFRRIQAVVGGRLATLALCVAIAGCGYSQPEESFLKSNWHIVHLDTPGMGTVADFANSAGKVQMSNGKVWKVLGWKKSDNVYTLHVQAVKEIEFRFIHVLSAPSSGAESVLDAVTVEGKPVNPAQAALDVQAAGHP
jgi:hypothetical protein